MILHHTENSDQRSMQDLNEQFIERGEFGIPYDIVILRTGNVVIGPRWLYAQKPQQILVDVPVFYVTRYHLHHPGGIGTTGNYHMIAVHVALEGNFDIERPSPIQYAALDEVSIALSSILLRMTEIKMHSDIEVTSCPGVLLDGTTGNRFTGSGFRRVGQPRPGGGSYVPILPPYLTGPGTSISGGVPGTNQFDFIPGSFFQPPFFQVLSFTSTTITLEWGLLSEEFPIVSHNLYMTGPKGQSNGVYIMHENDKIAEIPSSQSVYMVENLLPGFEYSFNLTNVLSNGRESDPV